MSHLDDNTREYPNFKTEKIFLNSKSTDSKEKTKF